MSTKLFAMYATTHLNSTDLTHTHGQADTYSLPVPAQYDSSPFLARNETTQTSRFPGFVLFEIISIMAI